MKKVILFILTVTMVLSFSTAAFAKPHKTVKQNAHQTTHYQKHAKVKKKAPKVTEVKKNTGKANGKHLEFKIDGSPVIKYGNYLLPLSPVTKGMGATVTFDKDTAVLTVSKGTITIVIDFKNQTVTVNGVADTTSGIFTSSNSHKRVVLIQYIAKVLGIKVEADDDDVQVEVPNLEAPKNIVVTPVGGTVVPNTLNNSTLFFNASAVIKAGQATGGKAELYVGDKLVATDNSILATDTKVDFTTSDGTPTNAELQALVATGGAITVKLYDAANKTAVSKDGNPVLNVDYKAPTVAAITSAVFNKASNHLYLNVTGAGAVGDKVDTTKIIIYDTVLGRSFQLTKSSTGTVVSENSLVLDISAADENGLIGFGNTTTYLTVAAGSLLSDTAGNTSAPFATTQTVPVVFIN